MLCFLKKKIIYGFLLLIGSSLCFSQEYSPEIQRIFDRGKLVVAMYKSDTYPLFYKSVEGNLEGFDVELAKDIAKTLGVKIEFNRSATSFDSILDLVNCGEADMGISLISITPARALVSSFSNPYLEIHPVLVANRLLSSAYSDDSIIDDIQKTKPMFVEKAGTSYIDMAKNIFRTETVVTETEWESVFDDVITGDVLFSLRDEIGVTNFMADRKDLAVKLRFKILTGIKDRIGIVVSPESDQLRSWLNIYLEQNSYPKNAKNIFSNYTKK